MGNAAILGILAYMREWEVCFGKTCGFVCTCDQISHGLELSVPIGSNRWSLPQARATLRGSDISDYWS